MMGKGLEQCYPEFNVRSSLCLKASMFEILVVVLCLILNAFLSCVEMAFISVSKPHLKQLALKGNLRAQKVLKLHENPERTLSVLQIGITLVGAVSAAVGGAGAEELLSPFLQTHYGFSSRSADAISIVSIVLPLTYLSVVIGELVPKSLALRYPMKLILASGFVLQSLDKIFAPFVGLLELSTRVLLRLISAGLPIEANTELNTSIDLEPLSEANKQYVLNLISIDKRTVKDIFVPWEDVTILNIADHYRVVLRTIQESRHTRIPVIENEVPIGILHAKEFVSEGEVSRLDWTELIRPVPFFESTEPILSVFKKLQSSRSHLAIVKNGKTVLGIVTIEDVFEEFVGDIFDEDDSPRVLLSSNSKIRKMGIKPVQ